MSRVVVIGGGIAAYCAALGARREGAEVVMLAKAPGATALYSGAMEMVDDLDGVLKTEPNHPLCRLKLDAVRLSTDLDTAIPALLLGWGKERLEVDGTWRSLGSYAAVNRLARP